MKNCLRIPRMLLPREGFDKWAVIACDQFTQDRAYWERVARTVADAPSTLRFILPEVYLGEEDEEARIAAVRKCMYDALESDVLTKLTRGLVFCERTTRTGVRRGILCCIDLEEFSSEEGVPALIRSSEEVLPARLAPRLAERENVPLEFPHAILFYRDKKDIAVKTLLREELEQLYDFDLMEGGGHLTGWFVPEDCAEEIVQLLHGKGEPAFAVADGNHSVAAAKAHWENVKRTLKKEETARHPARFMLCELVNLYDPSVVFYPIHRLVKDVETEAFCDFFMKNVRCRREGNVLIPALPAGAEGVRRTDELCEAFVRANGGAIDYVHGDRELALRASQEDCAGVMLAAMDKDDFFPALKGGVNFPKKTFSLGGAKEKRYYLEGREISYD